MSAAPTHSAIGRARDSVVSIALGLLLLASSFVAFYRAPVGQFTDSDAMLLVSQSLVDSGRFSVDRYVFDPPETRPATLWKSVHGTYHYMPPGPALLSTPAVWLLNRFGLSCVSSDGVTYTRYGDLGMQRLIAASLMAMLTLVVFATARRFLSVPAALLVTLVTAGGTPIMSTASRALWSHTWGILLLQTALWILVHRPARLASSRMVLLASLLSWTFFCRPTFALSIIGVTGYLFWVHRRGLLPFVATGTLWLMASFAFSLHYFHRLFPPYVQLGTEARPLGGAFMAEGVLGHLISPSRGLLVYVPIVALVGIVLWRRRRYLTDRPLAAAGVSVCVAHVLLVSATEPQWWAGHAFGPRYMTDMVPWLVLLGIQAAAAESRHAHAFPANARWHVALTAAAIALGAASLFVNLMGAWSEATWGWNARLADPDWHRALWDWLHPPFLAGLRAASAAPGVSSPRLAGAAQAGSNSVRSHSGASSFKRMPAL